MRTGHEAPALPFLSEYRAFGYSIGAVLILVTDNLVNVRNLRMRMIPKATNKGRAFRNEDVSAEDRSAS